MKRFRLLAALLGSGCLTLFFTGCYSVHHHYPAGSRTETVRYVNVSGCRCAPSADRHYISTIIHEGEEYCGTCGYHLHTDRTTCDAWIDVRQRDHRHVRNRSSCRLDQWRDRDHVAHDPRNDPHTDPVDGTDRPLEDRADGGVDGVIGVEGGQEDEKIEGALPDRADGGIDGVIVVEGGQEGERGDLPDRVDGGTDGVIGVDDDHKTEKNDEYPSDKADGGMTGEITYRNPAESEEKEPDTGDRNGMTERASGNSQQILREGTESKKDSRNSSSDVVSGNPDRMESETGVITAEKKPERISTAVVKNRREERPTSSTYRTPEVNPETDTEEKKPERISTAVVKNRREERPTSSTYRTPEVNPETDTEEKKPERISTAVVKNRRGEIPAQTSSTTEKKTSAVVEEEKKPERKSTAVVRNREERPQTTTSTPSTSGSTTTTVVEEKKPERRSTAVVKNREETPQTTTPSTSGNTSTTTTEEKKPKRVSTAVVKNRKEEAQSAQSGGTAQPASPTAEQPATRNTAVSRPVRKEAGNRGVQRPTESVNGGTAPVQSSTAGRIPSMSGNPQVGSSPEGSVNPQ